MSASLNDVEYLLSEVDPAKLEPSVAEVAFVGRSNVGKSTLLNALCRKDLARTSKTPGRTRALNVFRAGKDRWLVDLPGYGFAKGPEAERAAWGPMIEGYLRGRASLRMILLLIDAEVGPTKLDLRMVEWVEAGRLPWRAVATKTDKLRPTRAAAGRRDAARAIGIEPQDMAWVSAKDGSGVRELRAEIGALLG